MADVRLARGEARPNQVRNRPPGVTNGDMASETQTARAQDEDEAVAAWRAARLEAAGFDPALAGRLARDRGFDLHALLELIDRGCPPGLAARIVRPLE